MNWRKTLLILSAAALGAAFTVPVAASSDDPFGIQVVRQVADLMQEDIALGQAEYWNTRNNFIVSIAVEDDWLVESAQVYAGLDPPELKKDRPVPGRFPCRRDLAQRQSHVMLACDLRDELELTWGRTRERFVAIHADLIKLDADGVVVDSTDVWAVPISDPMAVASWAAWPAIPWGGFFVTPFSHPRRGHFVDSPVAGLGHQTPTQWGVTDDAGAFDYFPGESVRLWVGTLFLGEAIADTRISPLDLFMADTDDPRVINMARLLQSLDADGEPRPKITIEAGVVDCLEMAMDTLGLVHDVDRVGASTLDFGDDALVDQLIGETLSLCASYPDLALAEVDAPTAVGNLEAGLNASGIFRKNISKTDAWAEDKQKLEVMPVYFPGVRSNGNPSLCYDENGDGIYDDGVDVLGVPYEEWRLDGDPLGEECDPRLAGDACVVTLIECRELAEPLVVNYLAQVDIYDDQVNEAFWPGRFSWDVFVAISRDDGATWKRMNVSRMADLSSFELETGEPFPGSAGSPYVKVNDNQILVVWQSKFCKSGNPRYSITKCDDPATEEIEVDDPLTEENECAVYCSGNAEQGTEVCEPDYPGDDAYYVTDIWGVRGHQGSVDYDEVDDVAELGIGEIPYSCLWATRGVIVSQKDLDAGAFASLNIADDPDTPDVDETHVVELGDIIWFKPERITSGRRDAYVPMIDSVRGAGFAIAWQEDPSGLRPGKGKGPGEGWSGAISNHKTDIWYTFVRSEDFALVDEGFEPGGPGGGTDAEPTGDEGYLDKPGLGRPKALVPFALPVRVSDNDMVNIHTLKVEASGDCVVPEGGTEPVCFPEVVDGSFVPIDPEEIAKAFCGHPEADPATCCDPEDHQGDPNCEDLKGFFGNLNGTKRYAYLARTVDDDADGVPDYQYYEDRGGTLDLCDLSGANSYMDLLPGTVAHERWFGFANAAGASKLVCVTSDGRLLDGDVFASRPMLKLQPYTKPDGTKSAWALLAYEESKGLGHSLAAEEHEDTDNPVDEIVGDTGQDDSGQDKPIKQDLGKNLLYHSFDFTQPDLIAPGHIVNLPALCGGLYPTWCDDPKTPDVVETNPDNVACTCTPGEPVPLHFDYWQEGTDPETDPGQWLPDPSKFMQYRTEIARRVRFLVQPPSRLGSTNTLGAIIFKQGQEGQGRPADAFIRRFVKSGSGNPYRFENIVCTTYLDETFDLPACPNGAGDKPSAVGYNCNVWGEASGDRLCGGVFVDPNGGYPRRDHINLTSADVDLAVDAGPVDETPDDPTDDRYGTHKVLLWSQHDYNLGDESYGLVKEDGSACDVLAGEVCPAMYSNVRSHRGFLRRDFFVIAYAMSPNWAAARNGNDRYNFYVRRSFDGGQTWTTDPAGAGVYVCPEFRTDPDSPDPDGSGNLPPAAYDDTCGTYEAVPEGELPPMPVGVASTHHLEPMGATPDGVTAQHIGPGAFEPARNVSEIKSNKETSADPRLGTTPPVYPLDGTSSGMTNLCPQGACVFVEDNYVDNMFFVAWGTADNEKTTGGDSLKTEASPLDVYYTRSEDFGDTYVKVPWVIGGVNSNLGYGETVWRYDYVAKGDPDEQGECQMRATSDGSKAYIIWHSLIAIEDPDEVPSRWYPWKPEPSYDDDLWFRRVIFWPDAVPTP